ncbi:MAG: response regulator [Myxococcota bacterium]
MSRRVLVVDDNQELAENIAELLEDEGYTAAVFADPAEAIADAEAHPYDVAILDVRMPGMDGVTLYKKLSDMRPEADYVLMTAFTTDERIADAMAAGVRAVLPKPVPVEDLFELLPPPEAGADAVLILEDDRELASGLAEALRERSYRPLVVETLSAARTALARSPALAGAVVDVRLPDGDGSEMARELCARRIPVVLITGYEPTEAVEAARESCGARCQVLTKPFNPTALLETLQGLTAQPPSSSP